jgi:hypothetical protein
MGWLQKQDGITEYLSTRPRDLLDCAGGVEIGQNAGGRGIA